jgi:hypothetical protein
MTLVALQADDALNMALAGITAAGSAGPQATAPLYTFKLVSCIGL